MTVRDFFVNWTTWLTPITGTLQTRGLSPQSAAVQIKVSH